MTKKEKALKLKAMRTKLSAFGQAVLYEREQLDSAIGRLLGLIDEYTRLEKQEVEDVSE